MTTEQKTESGAILELCKFNPWNLAGDRNNRIRQRLMSLLTGIKVPIAKSGVNAIVRELDVLTPNTEDQCMARRHVAYKAYFSK